MMLLIRIEEPSRHCLVVTNPSLAIKHLRQANIAIAAERLLNSLDQRMVTFIEDIILRANAEKLLPEFRKLYEEDLDELYEQKDEQEDNQGDKS
jgi:hypothetical protein